MRASRTARGTRRWCRCAQPHCQRRKKKSRYCGCKLERCNRNRARVNVNASHLSLPLARYRRELPLGSQRPLNALILAYWVNDFRPGATLAALAPAAPPAPYATDDAFLFLHDDEPKCWATQPPADALDKSERAFIEQFAAENGLRVNFHRTGWLAGRALVVFRLALTSTADDESDDDRTASDDESESIEES